MAGRPSGLCLVRLDDGRANALLTFSCHPGARMEAGDGIS
jgi:hypothetical protein